MFETLSRNEMMDIDGGFVITGAMIAAGAGCLGAGVAVGYALGTVYKWLFG